MKNKFNMQTFVIVLSVMCVAVHFAKGELSTEFKEKFLANMERVGEKCAKETGASQDDIAKIITKEVPESHEGKCMLFCGHREFHIQRADGTLDLDGAIASLDFVKAEDMDLHDKMVQIFKTCSTVPVVADPCEYAVELSTCGVHEADKMGIDSSMLE